jgi:hypothetical protein
MRGPLHGHARDTWIYAWNCSVSSRWRCSRDDLRWIDVRCGLWNYRLYLDPDRAERLANFATVRSMRLLTKRQLPRQSPEMSN